MLCPDRRVGLVGIELVRIDEVTPLDGIDAEVVFVEEVVVRRRGRDAHPVDAVVPRYDGIEDALLLVRFVVLPLPGDDGNVLVLRGEAVIDAVGRVFEHGFVVDACHLLVHVEVGVLREGLEGRDRHDEDDEGDDHGQARPEHAVAVLFLQLHHLHAVRLLVVGVLLLELIEIVLHVAHDERLFAHLDALVDIEGRRDEL